MAGIIVIFVLNDKKFSSHMAQISEKINSTNHKIYFNDEMINNIFNFCSKNYQKQHQFHMPNQPSSESVNN